MSYGVNGINGWIELKYLPDFPRRSTTPVRFRNFTDEQRDWLTQRGRYGGYCWMLAQINRDYLLFDHTVIESVGAVPKKELIGMAVGHWEYHLEAAELLQLLQARK